MNDLFTIENGAHLSEDRAYRYMLWRRWEKDTPYVLFICLNPSTADEKEDDRTINRCKKFAADWGYGAVYMANLFAIRATDPEDMLAHPEPIGDENDSWIQHLAKYAGLIVCGWGPTGTHMQQDQHVKALLSDYELKCIKYTKDGHPWHPLYLKADKQLEDFK